MRISGKVALITGAAQGLGLATCDLLVQKGAKVAVVDIDKAAYDNALKDRDDNFAKNTIFIAADVTSKSQLENAFKKTVDTFGGLDIVGNNAGIMNEVKWEQEIDINVKGVVHGIKLGEQYMSVKNGGRGGVIINTASIAGLQPQFPWLCVYNGTKAAVIAMTKSCGCPDYYSETGIRYNALCPRISNTDLQFMEGKFLDGSHYEKWEVRRQCIESENSLVQPRQVAEGFVKLIEDDDLNGQSLEVHSKGQRIWTK